MSWQGTTEPPTTVTIGPSTRTAGKVAPATLGSRVRS
jgi:hypothetical protein